MYYSPNRCHSPHSSQPMCVCVSEIQYSYYLPADNLLNTQRIVYSLHTYTPILSLPLSYWEKHTSILHKQADSLPHWNSLPQEYCFVCATHFFILICSAWHHPFCLLFSCFLAFLLSLPPLFIFLSPSPTILPSLLFSFCSWSSW